MGAKPCGLTDRPLRLAEWGPVLLLPGPRLNRPRLRTWIPTYSAGDRPLSKPATTGTRAKPSGILWIHQADLPVRPLHLRPGPEGSRLLWRRWQTCLTQKLIGMTAKVASSRPNAHFSLAKNQREFLVRCCEGARRIIRQRTKLFVRRIPNGPPCGRNKRGNRDCARVYGRPA